MPSSPNRGSDMNVALAATAGDGPGDAAKNAAKFAMPKAGSDRCTVDIVVSLLSRRLFIAALALTVASLVTLGMFQLLIAARSALHAVVVVVAVSAAPRSSARVARIARIALRIAAYASHFPHWARE
ncbi:unnamed protein product [Closterium sp. NIES-53]